MAPRLCEEQQVLLSNNMKYSDFIAGKYLFFPKLLHATVFQGCFESESNPVYAETVRGP